MNQDELKKLYNDQILSHNRAPYHFEECHNSNHESMAYNPMCGDKFKIQLIEKGGLVRKAYFTGIGCAVSKASTSILMKKIEGKSFNEIKNLTDRFLDSMKEGSEEGVIEDKLLDILIQLKNFGGRIDCIQLSWKAINEYVTQSSVK